MPWHRPVNHYNASDYHFRNLTRRFVPDLTKLGIGMYLVVDIPGLLATLQCAKYNNSNKRHDEMTESSEFVLKL